MTELALSLGSNIDAESNIRRALKALQQRFTAIRCSSVYESEAIGFEGDNFLNLVAVVETNSSLTTLASYLKELEDEMGRDRSQPRFSARIIDIDILSYGNNRHSNLDIVLPRPEITRNAFVLRPLAELLPDQIHSTLGVSFAALWEDFDQSSQRLWPVEFEW